MKKEFYILKDEYDKGYADAIYRKSSSKSEICEVCGGVRPIIEGNLKVEFRGKKNADYYKVPQHSIVNEKIYNILKKNNISGFNIKDIDVLGCYDKRGKRINFDTKDLKELIVTGRCGYLRGIDGCVLKKCEKCGRVKPTDLDGTVGLSINISDWDGSDICYFNNLEGIPVVTQKVKDLFIENKIKNVRFISLKNYKF